MSALLKDPNPVAQEGQLVMRTSDRSAFRRCRRKWDFTSHLRQNLTSTEQKSYLWLGTGGHFALEDWYGYNYYGSPVVAFEAYVTAQQQWAKKMKGLGGSKLPEDYEEQATLAKGILNYFLEWIKVREDYPTYMVDGEPQTEIRLNVPIDLDIPGIDNKLVYGCTLDRVVIIDDELWITDYKFNKNFDTNPLEWNQQMSAYIWAASTIYDLPIAGGILWQFKKEVPKQPRVLSNGLLSANKSQLTTHILYRQALIDMYGSVDGAPEANVHCLNELAKRQADDSDQFIRRDRTYRTWEQQQAEGDKMLMEARDMFDPDLPLYPNPTKDCGWDCEVKEVCLMIDREDDWEQYANMHMTKRQDMNYEDRDGWREYLPQ